MAADPRTDTPITRLSKKHQHFLTVSSKIVFPQDLVTSTRGSRSATFNPVLHIADGGVRAGSARNKAQKDSESGITSVKSYLGAREIWLPRICGQFGSKSYLKKKKKSPTCQWQLYVN